MRQFLWAMVFLGALAGGIVLALSFLGGSGAPQQAAGAGVACALGVLPYVAARAWDEALARK